MLLCFIIYTERDSKIDTAQMPIFESHSVY